MSSGRKVNGFRTLIISDRCPLEREPAGCLVFSILATMRRLSGPRCIGVYPRKSGRQRPCADRCPANCPHGPDILDRSVDGPEPGLPRTGQSIVDPADPLGGAIGPTRASCEETVASVTAAASQKRGARQPALAKISCFSNALRHVAATNIFTCLMLYGATAGLASDTDRSARNSSRRAGKVRPLRSYRAGSLICSPDAEL